MPTKPTAAASNLKFTAWSYSRLSDYEKCPRMAFYKHLKKLPQPDNQAQARGTQVHADAVGLVTGAVTMAQLAKKYAKDPKGFPHGNFKDEFKDLKRRAKTVTMEGQVGLDKNWNLTEWFDSDAREQGLPLPWVRIVMDLRYTYEPTKGTRAMKIVDHKTGQVYPESEQQLELYAMAGFAIDPSVEVCECELWYLDQGEIKPNGGLVVPRTNADLIAKKWEKRVAPMMKDTKFKCNPGNACRWCPYSSGKRGPCEY